MVAVSILPTRVDRAAELLQIVLAAFAFQQVLVEPRARLGVQRAVEIRGDEFDELIAVHIALHFDSLT